MLECIVCITHTTRELKQKILAGNIAYRRLTRKRLW